MEVLSDLVGPLALLVLLLFLLSLCSEMIRLSGNHSPSAVCVYLRVGRSLHFARGLDFPVHHPSDAIVIDVVTLVHHRAFLVYSIDQNYVGFEFLNTRLFINLPVDMCDEMLEAVFTVTIVSGTRCTYSAHRPISSGLTLFAQDNPYCPNRQIYPL